MWFPSVACSVTSHFWCERCCISCNMFQVLFHDYVETKPSYKVEHEHTFEPEFSLESDQIIRGSFTVEQSCPRRRLLPLPHKSLIAFNLFIHFCLATEWTSFECLIKIHWCSCCFIWNHVYLFVGINVGSVFRLWIRWGLGFFRSIIACRRKYVRGQGGRAG